MGPLIQMLSEDNIQVVEMAAFALGRLAQNADNQAGIVQAGGLVPLLSLLGSKFFNPQHNAAFALYGLSDNNSNIAHFLQSGAGRPPQKKNKRTNDMRCSHTRTHARTHPIERSKRRAAV